jgi:hypothetical protein
MTGIARRQAARGLRRILSRSAAALAVAVLLASCTGAPTPQVTVGNPSSVAPLPSVSPPPSPSLPPIIWKPQVKLTFDYEEGVRPDDKALVRSALKQAVPLFPYPHRRAPRRALIAVFVHAGNGEIRRPNEIAEVRRQSVHVFVGGDGWRSSTPLQRRQAMFHEWVHIVQQLEAPFGLGPVWLTEGSAEWAAWEAMIRKGLASRSSIEDLYVRGAQLVDRDRKLKNLEGQRFYRSDPDGLDYALGYEAVELLHPARGWKTIVTFYQALGDGYHWREDFRSVFGISVTRFYRTFEADRASGFIS